MCDDKVLNRFLSKIKKQKNGCWIWQGKTSQKHGLFWDGTIKTHAHRWSYMYFVGPIIGAKRQFIHHKCGNRLCVNPKHLFISKHSSCVKKDFEPYAIKNKKITLTQKRIILKSYEPDLEFAHRFNVSIKQIQEIRQIERERIHEEYLEAIQ